MGLITPDVSGIADGGVADASDVLTPINTITNEINGNLDNSNIAASAGISGSKIAANSVTADALTGTALGYAEITSSFTSTATPAVTDVTGLSLSFTVPTGGRRIRATVYARHAKTSATAGTAFDLFLQEGATVLQATNMRTSTTNYEVPVCMVYTAVVAAGSHTYKVTFDQGAAGTFTLAASSTGPAFLLIDQI